MCRAVLTLLVGLMLSLGGAVTAFAKGEVIWEGTQESKLFSLTGPKKVQITTEGVFINGRFKPAFRLSKDDACLYGLSNFPNTGYVNTSKAWDSALKKFDFVECQSIRLQAKHSYKFEAKSQNSVLINQKGTCGKVSLAQFNWPSAEIMASVDKQILTAAFQCDVTLVPGATKPTFNGMTERSRPDVAGELWTNSFRDQLDGDVQAGKLIVSENSPISGVGEGWWISPSIQDENPQLKTLADILARPDLFPDPSNPKKGAFHGCPRGWGCNLANRQLFKAFEMEEKGWRLIEPASAAEMDRQIASSVASNRNWFGYYWNPTATVGRYDLRPVNFGTAWAGTRHWNRCIRDSCRKPQPTSWIKSHVKTALTAEFQDREILASTYLKRRIFPGDIMNKLLVFMSDGNSSEDTARKFFVEYPEVWQQWLPLDAATAVASALGIPKPVAVASSKVEKRDSIKSQTSPITSVPGLRAKSDETICKFAKRIASESKRVIYQAEAKRRGLSCGSQTSPITTEIASSTTTQAETTTSAKLLAAQRKARELEQQVAALKAKQQKQQQIVSSDSQVPLITINSTSSKGPQGIISGRVTDNTGVGEVRVDGQLVAVDGNGRFTVTTYVPEGGVSVTVEAFDLSGLSSSMSVRLDRRVAQASSFSFARLNPLKRKVAQNPQATALIIGVANYKETIASAVYADSDAKVFADYAVEKLGVSRQRIKTLVNDGADEKDVLLAAKRWLARGTIAGQSDVYIFFAGHGLASDDGENMYLLPYDGAPELLEDTAVSRERLFSDIAAANPRSVTVFLDTCYSGTTRGTETLIASRPIAIRAKEQAVPEGFTVMTAAAGDQTAKPLEEAKHGMFSYFLMKGMEGDADANQDNQITAGELHAYVQQNVIQQSSGSQTPELQGDADRVLVRFQ